MAERTVSAVLREMDAVKKSGLDAGIADLKIRMLKLEAEAMIQAEARRASAQLQLGEGASTAPAAAGQAAPGAPLKPGKG